MNSLALNQKNLHCLLYPLTVQTRLGGVNGDKMVPEEGAAGKE